VTRRLSTRVRHGINQNAARFNSVVTAWIPRDRCAAADRRRRALRRGAANNLTLNNMTIVPNERLTNEELDFYLALAEKGRAIPIQAPKPDSP